MDKDQIKLTTLVKKFWFSIFFSITEAETFPFTYHLPPQVCNNCPALLRYDGDADCCRCFNDRAPQLCRALRTHHILRETRLEQAAREVVESASSDKGKPSSSFRFLVISFHIPSDCLCSALRQMTDVGSEMMTKDLNSWLSLPHNRSQSGFGNKVS